MCTIAYDLAKKVLTYQSFLHYIHLSVKANRSPVVRRKIKLMSRGSQKDSITAYTKTYN